MRALLAAAVLVLASTAAVAAPFDGGRGRPGDFDLYLLALTWSPGFCATDARRGGEDGQCARGAGLGFLVHGLWPQYERGYPSDCRDGETVQRRDIESVRGIMPSDGLARYEWRKHGTCSGLAPSRYFSAIRDWYGRVRVPQAWRDTGRPMTLRAQEVRRALVEVNPGLRADMIALDCARGPGGAVLKEVRLCLTRDLRSFRACPQAVQRSSCRAPAVSILPVH